MVHVKEFEGNIELLSIERERERWGGGWSAGHYEARVDTKCILHHGYPMLHACSLHTLHACFIHVPCVLRDIYYMLHKLNST